MPKPRNTLDLETLAPPVRAAVEAAPDGYAPSRHQYKQWGAWVNWDLGTDPTGWFYGWCPIHDTDRTQRVSGMYHWKSGVVRCMAAERCYGKPKTISMQTMALMMVRYGVEQTNGEG